MATCPGCSLPLPNVICDRLQRPHPRDREWMNGWMDGIQTNTEFPACTPWSLPMFIFPFSSLFALDHKLRDCTDVSVHTHAMCPVLCLFACFSLAFCFPLSFLFFFLFTVTRAQKFQIRTGCSGSACIHYLFWCSVRLQSHNQTEQLSLFSVSQWLNLLQPRGRNLAHLA